MSQALYELGGLRFWNQDELQIRRLFTERLIQVVKETLLNFNPAWQFFECEGPCLSPRTYVHSSYSDEDVFVTNHNDLVLRPETTASSYAYAYNLKKKLPLCVYQAGKSFRRELNDGATASKLRFNEFWQLEFQCIYSEDTKSDYRSYLIPVVSKEISRFTQKAIRTIDSRLPVYSESTKDIEIFDIQSGDWREIASCSIRTDYGHGAKVCEIAIGLDRVVSLS